MDSIKLKPLTNENNNIPIIGLSKPFGLCCKCSSPSSPKKFNPLIKLNSIDSYDDKVKSLGEFFFSTKKELINNFNTGYYKLGFWTNIQSKTLGTFLVVTTIDSKIYFISMRHKLVGCNYQYDFVKNNIKTMNCNCCELNFNLKIKESIYYEFPDEVIILTPKEPYQLPNILSKM